MTPLWLAVFAGLLLSGCVHVPSANQLLTSAQRVYPPGTDASCNGALPAKETSEPKSTLDPSSIRLLSWNVQKGADAKWSEDLLELSMDKDLVVLQEAHLTDSFGETLEQTGLHWSLARAFEYRDAETGVMTASTTQPTGTCLSRHREPILRVPKSVLVTTYPMQEPVEDLLLINLHGINFTFDTEAFAGQLRDTLELTIAHSGPVVVAGDFNDWNMQRSQIVQDITDAHGLRSLTLERDERSRHLGSPVDHVFFRGLDVVAATAIPVSSSDHNPLVVTFSLADDKAELER